MEQDYLYKQIISYILQSIENGTLNSSSRLPTEAELSEKFNVSRITSRKAMDELASQGVILRRKRLGSFINPNYNIKTGMVEVSSGSDFDISDLQTARKLVGLVLPINTNMGDMMLYVNGVLDYITSRGYYLIITNSNRDSVKEKELITAFIKDRVSGIIYYPYSDRHNYSLLTKLSLEHYPIVLIDKFFADIDIPYVIPDSYMGARKITDYLFDCGHTRIAFLYENEISEFSTIRDRFAGYCDSLKSHNMSIDDDLIFENVVSKKQESNDEFLNDMKSAVKNIVANNATAIFCPADGIAITVLDACAELNIQVPDDLSITGFDDLAESSHAFVPITTVRQDLYSMGTEAAKVLIRMIEGKPVKRKTVHPVKLIVRASVKDQNK